MVLLIIFSVGPEKKKYMKNLILRRGLFDSDWEKFTFTKLDKQKLKRRNVFKP